ncbi:MAG: Ig-like domain-containing protein [Pseudomonadota bacterium]
MRSIWEGFCERLTRPMMVGTVASLLLVGCGGGGVGTPTSSTSSSSTSSTTSSTSSGTTTVPAAGIQLLVSSPQMKSDGSEKIDVTLVVTDSNSAVIPTKNVTLSVTDTVSSGGVFLDTLSSTAGQTGADGKLTAKLNVGTNRSNRTVTLTASADGITTTNTVAVAGTTVSISGSNTIVQNGTTNLTISVKDSGGTAVQGATVNLSSIAGNTISGSTTTNTNGQVQVQVTGTVAGNDTISASTLGATTTQSLSVSEDDFQYVATSGFVKAADSVTVTPLNTAASTPGRVAVKWLKNGVAQVGKSVTFSVTRGVVSLTSPINANTISNVVTTSVNAITAGDGVATVYVASAEVGAAKITAIGHPGAGQEPSGSLDVDYVTSTANSIDLQADKTTLPLNVASSETYQSRVIATIRDSSNNLVKGATVTFSLVSDLSGGRLSLSTAITDVKGQASVYYIAGTSTSPQNGVEIRAAVQNNNAVTITTISGTLATVAPANVTTGLNPDLQITVGGQALFVRIGTDSKLASDSVRRSTAWSALITDSAGNPVANQSVQFTLKAQYFWKGRLVWDSVNSPNAYDFIAPGASHTRCDQEDINFNSILDTGEDTNGNAQLTPGNVAVVASSATAGTGTTSGNNITITTDSLGFADAFVVYPASFAYWASVTLQAKVNVGGTESQDTQSFMLTGLASDYTSNGTEPPGGLVSPYGPGTNCTDTN